MIKWTSNLHHSSMSKAQIVTELENFLQNSPSKEDCIKGLNQRFGDPNNMEIDWGEKERSVVADISTMFGRGDPISASVTL